MQPAGFSKTHRPAQHGRARQMHFARLEHDGLVERLMLPAIAFADENAEKNGVLGNLHKISFYRLTILPTR